jgi:hypothetical protein
MGGCVETALLKNAVFRDLTPCGSCKIRRFGGTHRLNHQGDKNRRAYRERCYYLAGYFHQKPHGVTSQNTAFFMVNADKTSILT